MNVTVVDVVRGPEVMSSVDDDDDEDDGNNDGDHDDDDDDDDDDDGDDDDDDNDDDDDGDDDDRHASVYLTPRPKSSASSHVRCGKPRRASSSPKPHLLSVASQSGSAV